MSGAQAHLGSLHALAPLSLPNVLSLLSALLLAGAPLHVRAACSCVSTSLTPNEVACLATGDDAADYAGVVAECQAPAGGGAITDLTVRPTFNASRRLVLDSEVMRPFEQLTSLRSLVLSRNGISELNTTAFSALPTLQRLDLSRNSIVTLLDATFSSLANLQHLSLSDNTILDVQLRAFAGLSAISELYLDRNRVSLSAYNSLANLSTLLTLSVSCGEPTFTLCDVEDLLATFPDLSTQLQIVLSANRAVADGTGGDEELCSVQCKEEEPATALQILVFVAFLTLSSTALALVAGIIYAPGALIVKLYRCCHPRPEVVDVPGRGPTLIDETEFGDAFVMAMAKDVFAEAFEKRNGPPRTGSAVTVVVHSKDGTEDGPLGADTSAVAAATAAADEDVAAGFDEERDAAEGEASQGAQEGEAAAAEATAPSPPPPEEDDECLCPICTDEFEPNDFVATLKCGHPFHTTCLRPWLKDQRTCPLCRAEVRGVIPLRDYVTEVATPPDSGAEDG